MRHTLLLLIASTSFAAFAGAGSAHMAAGAQASAEPAVSGATDRPKIGAYGFDESGMNRGVKPGDNMYEYANGTWAKSTPIPADKSNYGMFTALADLSDQRTRTIVEEAGKAPGSKMGDLYASFMDRAAVEAAGVKPVQPLFRMIDAAKSAAEVAALLARLDSMGVSTPFSSFTGGDDKAPTTTIYRFVQSGIGMPDRDYYISGDSGLAAKKAAYRDYLGRLLTLAGEADAAERAAAVVDFETKLAQVQWTQHDIRDAEKTYNKWARSEFAAKAPGVDWDSYLKTLGVGSEANFLVAHPSAISGMSKIVAETPPALLKDYLKLRVLDKFAPYLSTPFVNAKFAFQGTTLNGIPQIEEEWKRGVELVTSSLGHEVGKAYVARYYPPEAKAEMDKLIANILAALDTRIQNLSWMTPQTKQRARGKLKAFYPRIGYPAKWRDYSTLEIRRDDLVGNVIRANEYDHRRQLGKLGKPNDRNDWSMLPMTVNAQANFNINAITFPAAILQPPFFDPKADPAINYGGIGAVIGHEISHHFDDQGSKYDETGALREWWTPEDVKRFNTLTDQLVAQYDKYEILPGKFLNGRFTLGDNVGDLAGLAVAYDAYKASLGGKEAPVIDGLTGDQRFFLSWAQVWRRNYREENLRQRLITDPHAPSVERVATVRNFDKWYEAFGVKPGDKLYLPPEQRVRIW